MQYIKDRTEGFDDYFPCRKNDCKLSHVRKWLNLFLDYHNMDVINAKVNRALARLCKVNSHVNDRLYSSVN